MRNSAAGTLESCDHITCHNIHIGFFLSLKSPIASITLVMQHSLLPVLKFLKVLERNLKL